MAKKKAGEQQQFTDPETGEEFGDAVPEAVQEHVDEYVRCLRARNRATEKLNAAKESCIEKMKEHGIRRVRIDEGAKWLEVTDEPKLKTRKIKEERGDSEAA